jgi:hypothetical protein
MIDVFTARVYRSVGALYSPVPSDWSLSTGDWRTDDYIVGPSPWVRPHHRPRGAKWT